MRKDFEKAMEENIEVKGVVMAARQNKELGVISLDVSCDAGNVVIPYTEVDINISEEHIPSSGMLARYIGSIVGVRILAVEPVVIGSIKDFKLRERELIVSKLKTDHVTATITGFDKFGAYITIGTISAIMRNRDFSDDFVEVKSIYKLGDKVNVKFLTENANHRITVGPVEKYKLTPFDLSQINEGDVLVGTLKSIREVGCFVNIAPGLDCLASLPAAGIEGLTEGNKVVFIVKKIDYENHRVRAAIIKRYEASYIVE